MAKEFFDDDLLRTGGGVDELADFDMETGVPVVPISEVGMNRLAKQKDEVSGQVANAVQKIEHLRSRQENLEKEKHELESLARQQEEYESGKKDVSSKLSRWLLLLEKERMQATRMVELLGETHTRFKESLDELDSIDESAWSDENFNVELSKALVKVSIAREVYSTAMARIEATNWSKKSSGEQQFEVVKEATQELRGGQSFGYWLKVGLAVSLPVIVVMFLLFVGWLIASGNMSM